jgi:hypothetical protein
MQKVPQVLQFYSNYEVQIAFKSIHSDNELKIWNTGSIIYFLYADLIMTDFVLGYMVAQLVEAL